MILGLPTAWREVDAFGLRESVSGGEVLNGILACTRLQVGLRSFSRPVAGPR
jgi:hypothetical protein